jgi:hypothetical protein
MTEELYELIQRLNNPVVKKTSVIPWGSPIASFGSISNSRLATLGLNPSNREFVDEKGHELEGTNRRFHTLSSLGLEDWEEANHSHVFKIAELCEDYFQRNPYDGWFKRLDYIISGTSMSYYFPSGEACHLDLIPYATAQKWTDLSYEQKTSLLEITGDTLGLLLKNSPIQVMVLNGQTVVDHLQKTAGIELKKTLMPSWTLPRKDSEGVVGYAYTGIIDSIAGIKLKQEVMILGYNHNIQSSFGVTTKVQTSIRNWVSKKTQEIFE